MKISAIESLAGLPPFAAYFGVALVLFGVFLVVYLWMTPYPEIKLIREGNSAASASLSGAVIGFALPTPDSGATHTSLPFLASNARIRRSFVAPTMTSPPPVTIGLWSR